MLHLLLVYHYIGRAQVIMVDYSRNNCKTQTLTDREFFKKYKDNAGNTNRDNGGIKTSVPYRFNKH